MKELKVDTRCLELARYFLGDRTPDDLVAELAQRIQDTVEEWIDYGCAELQPRMAQGFISDEHT